jgi:hypothetical protein
MSTIVYDTSKGDPFADLRHQPPQYPDRYSCSKFREELPEIVGSPVVPILVPLTTEEQLKRDELLLTLIGRISKE